METHRDALAAAEQAVQAAREEKVAAHQTAVALKSEREAMEARLIEAMETAGLVGPLQANGGREILVPAPAGE